MGPKCPPWYRTKQNYYQKQIKKSQLKIQKYKEKIEGLENEIKVLEEMSFKCKA